MSVIFCPTCNWPIAGGKCLCTELIKGNILIEQIKLYYGLKDGITWQPEKETVCFKSEQSARTFKNKYPDWIVKYRGTNAHLGDLPVILN
jgi:hypothetical protein